jgi:5'(3')-deoxyribonucleotidase
MKCFLDLDGVIADFVGGACKAHKRPNPYAGPTPAKEFDMDKIWGMTPEQFWAPMDYHFWAQLARMPDAHEILLHVESAFGRENVCILTSPARDPQCSSAKHAWIAACLPNYRRRFFIGSAKQFFARPDAVLVDDYDKNVDAFRDAGGQAILVPRPWNTNRGIEAVPYLAGALEETVKP